MQTVTREVATKKEYEPPVLTRYGTVEEITRLLGVHGNYDNRLHITKTTLR